MCRTVSLLCSLAFTLFSALHTSAESTRIAVIRPPDLSLRNGRWIVETLSASGDETIRREEFRIASDDAPLDVECRDRCRVSVQKAGAWSLPTIIVTPQRDAELRAWHADSIALKVQPGDARAEASVSLIGADGHLLQSYPFDAQKLDCTLSGENLTCSVPRTALDLRIESPKFAPKYAFDVPANGPRRPIVAVQLPRSGSITGWVTADGKSDLSSVSVELATISSGKDKTAKPVTTTANSRGFFQFTGLTVGRYAVSATQSGWSHARIADVDVQETRRDYLLSRPLILRELAEIRVWCDPSATPIGTAWTVRVARRVEDSNRVLPVAQEKIPLSGAWSRADLQHGSYVVSLLDDDGSVRARREVDLVDAVATVQFEIEQVQVRGNATVGDDPFAGQLQFSRDSGETVRTKTDDEGKFECLLPGEGMWRVRATPAGSQQLIRGPNVEVHRPKGDQNATLELRLPGGKVTGTVVDEQGRPVAASVIAFRDTKLIGSASAGPDGKFDLVALPPGPLSLEATTASDESGEQSCDVTDGNGDESVKIVIAPKQNTKLHILTESGEPLAGVTVRYTANTIAGRAQAAVSAANGECNLWHPPATALIDAIVLAPGYPTRIVQVRPSPQVTAVYMGGGSGQLTVLMGGAPPWPWIARGGQLIGLRFMMPPVGPGRSSFDDLRGNSFVVTVEPGSYQICSDAGRSGRCITTTVANGQNATADTMAFWTPAERSALRSAR